jgi:Uma2 family endonuclease
MSDPARRKATYADVLAAPRNMVAEVTHGTLHLQPRPRSRHARSTSAVGALLDPPFNWGDHGGPGGWVILDEPELHLDEQIVVPDLAGWRRERMPELPDAAFFELPPDWICEALSPSTAAFDRAEKMPIYAQQGVRHAWLIDPDLQTLEAFALEGSRWLLLAVFHGDVRVRVPPFEAVEIPLARLWAR